MGIAPVRLDSTATLTLGATMVVPVFDTAPTVTGFNQDNGPAAALITLADLKTFFSGTDTLTSPLTLGSLGAAFTIQGTTVASVADTASNAITLNANIGRGTGAVGGWVLAVPLTTSTGTTAQTLANALVVKATTVPQVHVAGTEVLPAGIVSTSLRSLVATSQIVAVNAAGTPTLRMTRVEGTLAAPTIITTGLALGNLTWSGAFTSTTTANGALIAAVSTEAWVASTASGTKITFSVTPNTTTGAVLGMTLDQDKSLTVVGKFACNGGTAQAAATIGAALATYGTGAFGLDSNANMQALYNQVVAMAAALKANGIAVT